MDSQDKQSFDRLVCPHFDALYRAAYRLARNREDAEDLVQDVCLRALANLSDLESASAPKAWLLSVQYRVFIDSHRRRRRSLLAPASGADNPAPPVAADEPGVEEFVDGLSSQGEILSAWECLEKDQRALLALHAEGYSLAELEVITGASRNAISARLHRARARLAKHLRAGSVVELPMKRMES